MCQKSLDLVNDKILLERKIAKQKCNDITVYKWGLLMFYQILNRSGILQPQSELFDEVHQH